MIICCIPSYLPVVSNLGSTWFPFYWDLGGFSHFFAPVYWHLSNSEHSFEKSVSRVSELSVCQHPYTWVGALQRSSASSYLQSLSLASCWLKPLGGCWRVEVGGGRITQGQRHGRQDCQHRACQPNQTHVSKPETSWWWLGTDRSLFRAQGALLDSSLRLFFISSDNIYCRTTYF